MDLHMVKEIYYHISFFFVYHMSQPDGWQHQGAAKREVGNRVHYAVCQVCLAQKIWDQPTCISFVP